MTRLVKPNHYQSVDEQRHRRGPRDGFGKTIGRILQAQELLAIFKGGSDFRCQFIILARKVNQHRITRAKEKPVKRVA
jgi:hypothetical protein